MSKVVEAFCDKAGGCFGHNLLGALGLDGICESKAFGDKVVISACFKEGDLTGVAGLSLGELGRGFAELISVFAEEGD